ncbi:putative 1-phosphatidylinositol 3-phosphate 5-kinase [Teleopsis dalmanni]|uniref:putative 1-phosphatidylinositol 3-phosphate 5-kinase n=1 Tax=Teleopsis dalmanni TaxID=139649 RepID=UPI0018CC824B|nr:putative 1-phosphatidylinositol 3-phosphate 5-kinase [Teleopsis dalmanni]
MNQHLHSPTKLTEFARDFEDEPETIFGRFVNKIQNAYNQSYNTVNEAPISTPVQVSKSVFYADSNVANTETTNLTNQNPVSVTTSSNITIPQTSKKLSSQVSNDPSTSSATSSSNTDDCSAKISKLPIESNEGRSYVNVLKRISNIVASKNSDLRNYKDTDLQRFWMPDSKAKECYDCTQKFSTFRRKHHCRLCGQIFCSKCCNQVVPGKIIKCSGELKVCNYCSKIVLSYLKSPNIAVDLHSDLQALQQNLSNKLEDAEESSTLNVSPTNSGTIRKASFGYQEERLAINQANILSFDDRKNILQQCNSLITLHEEMYRLLPAQNCGADLIEFLIANNKSSNKSQSIATLSAMLAAGFLQPIVPDSEQSEFDEQLHYKFLPSTRQKSELAPFGEFSDISSASSPHFEVNTEPRPIKSIDVSQSFHGMQDIELENSMRSTTTTSKLIESYCDHEEQLLTQMLRTYKLDSRWMEVLTPLCSRAANHFKPEYCSNDLMDIRNYVNFKKVPGGKRQECTIVGGVVFSKNVAHKDMATRVDQPRILLLQCPIVYERIEGKFVSISTVLLQEKEYLSNMCARIMSFKPNVVLVHKNVAGIAQDILRSKDITLVLDVKLSVMERLARTLQCDIVPSIESNITKPKLGLCDAFYINSYSDGSGTSKTLMFFEKLKCPRGYTCLLRGGNNKELALVKKVASFLVYARYNWRLEMSFLLDEYAQPLTPKPPIFDSKEPTPEDENANTCIMKDDEPQLRSGISKQIKERKSEDKIITVVTENVSDFTDPLRSTAIISDKASPDNSVGELAVETRYDNRFRNGLSSTTLSVSPFLTFPLPYLETEQGRNCSLRSLFPTELYFSKLWSTNCASNCNNNNFNLSENTETFKMCSESLIKPPHPFLEMKITAPIENRKIQTLLAEFRANGSRYPIKKKKFKLLKRRESYQCPQKISDDHVYKDALELQNHQRLPVLFCMFYFNPKAVSSFCTPPILLHMKFYGQQDIMLGQFLERYCSHFSSICTRCNLPDLGHVRRYVHSMGSVEVFLTEDSMKTDPNRIYFSAWCTKCKEVTPNVPLSDNTKYLSFAKYLELRFHGHAYKKRPLESNNEDLELSPKCEHSIHRDYIHCFSYRGVCAKFQYTSIEAWEIGLPALLMNVTYPRNFDHFKTLEEIKGFSMKGHEIYTRIHERIADLAIDDENSPLVAIFKTELSKDQFKFKQQVEIVQTLLTDPKANAHDINDSLLMSKRILAESIDLWDPRLQEITIAQKSATKQQNIDASTICTEDLRPNQLDISPTIPDVSIPPTEIGCEKLSQLGDNNDADNNTNQSSVDKKNLVDQLAISTASSDKKTIKQILSQLLPSVPHASNLESPFTSQEHYVLPLGAFPILVHEQDLSSVIAYSLTSSDYLRLINNSNGLIYENNDSEANIATGGNCGTGNQSSPNTKRKSQESGSVYIYQERDENVKENIPKVHNSHTNSNSSSHCNDEERKNPKHNSEIDITFQEHNTQFSCKIYFPREFDLLRAKTFKVPKLEKSLYKELEQSKKREELKVSQSRSGPEIELVRKPSDACKSLNTNPNKDDKFLLQTEVELSRNAFARSLCSSVQWEARGGKSGSKFCKTLDDRFVLKEMSKTDINIFENFAPNYFEYIAKCQQQNHPTLLAKIFGVYKVSVKKKDSYQEKTLLVMENLFYGCDIKSKFDLKGSERNRLVDPSNKTGETVLLDENFVQMSWSKPLYVLSHSKAVLKDAINRDSTFLGKNYVMDYSLLVGLDNNNGLLVLGIIDYIRTYTFDKKVESFVKQKMTLGSTGKLPTVIPPEQYKQRFADAMDRYFYTVPDRWEGLSKI